MAKVSIPPIRLPWKEKDIKSGNSELLADYLKVLNKTLQKKLEETGNVINVNATKLEKIETELDQKEVDTISELLQLDTTIIENGSFCFVGGYHTKGDGGGGIFYWDADEDKANHNGGTIIDSMQTFPSDWSDTAQQDTWFTASGSGTGCWKRVYSGSINVKWFGAKGNEVIDDTRAIQKAINVANVGGSVFLPVGVYLVTDTIQMLEHQKLIGENKKYTVIKGNISGAILKPAKGSSKLDGFKIDGNSVEDAIGILCDEDNRPHDACWGSIEILNCPDVALKLAPTDNGIYTNYFGNIYIHSCGVGILIEPTSPGFVNANAFGRVVCYSSNVAVRINGGSGNTFYFLLAENGNIGVDMQKGKGNAVLDGWLEGNDTNLSIGDNPDVLNFICWAQIDNTDSTPVSYNPSYNRSVLFQRDGNYFALGGRWFGEVIRMVGTHRWITHPVFRGYGLYYKQVTSGEEIDVSDVNVVFLNYSSSTTITNLTRTFDSSDYPRNHYQVVHLITNSGNVQILNGGNFILNGDWNPTRQGQTLTLIYDPFIYKWVELSRT